MAKNKVKSAIMNCKFKYNVKLIVFLCLFISNCTTLLAQQTLRLYLVGNSVTDAINYNGLDALAESRGNTHIWGRHMIPGAPLSWLWDNQTSGFTEAPFGAPNNAFPNYTWDAISLQPFDRLIEGSDGDKEVMDNYINLAKSNNPNVQLYVYMRWPRMPNNRNSLSACIECTADSWTTQWTKLYTAGYDGTNETKDYFEKLLVASRAFSPMNKPILIVPVGEVFNTLNTKMKNGLVPGYSSIWQVYSDGIHMLGVGSYIAAVTYYATIYKVDPRGLGVPAEFGTIPTAVVSAIQNSVWEVVSTYQYSGVSSSNIAVSSVSLSPTTLSLTNGQTSQLTANVLPTNATNKSITWTSSNSLVASISTTGLVTANGAGNASITATTADGGRTASSLITVTSSGGGGTIASGVLASWEFDNKGGLNNIAASTLMSQFSTATALIAQGLSPENYLSNGLTATNATATSLAAAISGNKYFSFTINPANGQNYSVNTIELNPISQGFTRTFSLLSSKNGFTSSNVIAVYTANAEFNGNKITLNLSDHNNIISSTEFRIYVHSSSTNVYESVGFGNAPASDLIISGSVGAAADTQAPSIPASLAATLVKASSLTLSWTNATDNVGVTGYDVFNGSIKLNTSLITTNTYNITGLAACTNYSYTVRAYDAAGNNSTTTPFSVKSNCAPTAVLNAAPTSGTSPLLVSFNANGSADADNGDFILGYEWDFGDGSALSNANAPAHTYNTPGTYIAKLRVLDNRESYSTQVTSTITVTNQPVTTGFLATWDFKSLGGNSSVIASAKNENVTSAHAALASGLSAINYLSDGLTGTNQTSMTLAEAIAGDDYISVTLVPVSGKSLSITKLELRPISQGFTRTFSVFSSKSGFAAANVISSFTSSAELGSNLVSIDISNHTNLTTNTEFRIYIYGRNNLYESVGFGNRGNSVGTHDLAVIGTTASTPPTAGSVIMEKWSNISGTSISNIPTSTTPNTISNLTSLELPINSADNYGTRIRGFIIPSTTGSYTFYISGDDDVDFKFSTNNTPANAVSIANIVGWTNSRQWNKYPSQTSAARILTAGTPYFFEVLHKEGSGGDNLAIGWTGPGISVISIIGGSNIAPFTGTPPPAADTQAPGVPSGLSAVSVSQTSFTLNWTASTDNVGVTGYEVYRNGTLMGTSISNSFDVTGLLANTVYIMSVRARDAVGNWSSQSSPLSVTTSSTPPITDIPKLPIGMNINSTNYYTAGLIFTDVMKSASSMFTFYDGGPWNSEQINNVPRDVNGYPTQLPINAGGQLQRARFLINNHYSGRYIVLFDGIGTFNVNGIPSTTINGKRYIDFTGNGNYGWIDILTSQSGNHLRNIRIIPEALENSIDYPTFLPKFLEGLRPFHALRFMDWTATNNSSQVNWSDRCTNSYYSQSTEKGMSLDYAIELANLLNTSAWFCVPHMATDDYHTQMARLIRDNLNPSLKVYMEFSNEVWNWQFTQASYIVNNAIGHANSYVTADLAAISAPGSNHPEKDAYMMARMFRLFKAEFSGANASRLVKIAGVQHGWMDNTRRVLEYLRNANQQCDWVSPGGYFNFTEAQHNLWLTQCSSVTAAQVIAGADAEYAANEGTWTDVTAGFANQYGVGYAVYEGGQHMQPYLQGEWCYNQAVWDAQIHPDMYALYMKNFRKMIEPAVNCQLFMAFSYISERQSRYGSWGHLESLAQIGSANMMQIAPKYQALLDANSAKTAGNPAINVSGSMNDSLLSTVNNSQTNSPKVAVYPNPATSSFTINTDSEVSNITIITTSGRVVKRLNSLSKITTVNTGNWASGVYLIKVETGLFTTFKKVIIVK